MVGKDICRYVYVVILVCRYSIFSLVLFHVTNVILPEVFIVLLCLLNII